LNARLDESVVRACQQDDKAAYTVLVERHYRHVFAMCLGMLWNVHDAEDIAQEAMLKGFLKIKELDKPEQFEAWILQIARNLCCDSLRKKKRVKELSIDKPMQPRRETGENHDLQQAIKMPGLSLRS
jgi:RNA polymerase sigma-70 factor (ECF subfamily)